MSEAAGEREPGAYHRELVRSLVAGRRWIVASDVLVAGAATATSLRELGAEDVLVVAGSRGTGALDDDLERDAVLLGVSGGTIMEGMRAFHAALASPPAELVAAVEAFDPDGEAMAVVPATSGAEHLVGRAVFGARPEAWRRLEDKTLVDALWDRAGVPRAPSAIVPATASALTEAPAGSTLARARCGSRTTGSAGTVVRSTCTGSATPRTPRWLPPASLTTRTRCG